MKSKNTNKADVAPAPAGRKLQPPPITGYDCPCARNGLEHHALDCLYHSSRDIVPAQSGQHTPGPLMVADAKGTLCSFRIVEANERQRTVAFVAHSGSNSQDRSNADLFAAAPELLEALKRLLTLWEEAIGYETDYMDMADFARAAIAKAEGRMQ